MRIIVSSKLFAAFLFDVLFTTADIEVTIKNDTYIDFRPVYAGTGHSFHLGAGYRGDLITATYNNKQLKAFKRFLKGMPEQPVVIEFKEDTIHIINISDQSF